MTFPTTASLDNFNRADATTLGSSWTDIVNGWSISASQAAPENNGNDNDSLWSASTFGSDCEVYTEIPTLPTENNRVVNLWIRATTLVEATRDGYVGYYQFVSAGTDINRMYRADNNSFTQLGADVNQDFSAGDSLGVEAIVSDIALYRKNAGTWAKLMTRNDATYTSAGYIGIRGNNTGTRLDNFSGGTKVSSDETVVLWTNLLKTQTTTAVLWTGLRKTQTTTAVLWTDLKKQQSTTTVLWADLKKQQTTSVVVWANLKKQQTTSVVLWADLKKQQSTTTVLWTDLKKQQLSTVVLWADLKKQQTTSVVLWADLKKQQSATTVLWADLKKQQSATIILWSTLRKVQTTTVVLWSDLLNTQTTTVVLWASLNKTFVTVTLWANLGTIVNQTTTVVVWANLRDRPNVVSLSGEFNAVRSLEGEFNATVTLQGRFI